MWCQILSTHKRASFCNVAEMSFLPIENVLGRRWSISDHPNSSCADLSTGFYGSLLSVKRACGVLPSQENGVTSRLLKRDRDFAPSAALWVTKEVAIRLCVL
jgi:hypothetical protein